MTDDECRILMSVLKAQPALVEDMIADVIRNGWTEFSQVGPMRIALARVPNATGSRSNEIQVTIK